MTPHEHLPGCDERHTVRQACNSRGGDAVPAHLARDADGPTYATAVATAIVNDVQVQNEAQPISDHARGIADGPVETIDTQHVPVLPLIALVALTLTCVIVLWRLFARGGE